MTISAVSGPYYVPVTPVTAVQSSSRAPERRNDGRPSESEPPPRPSRPPPGQGRLVDVRA